MATDIAKAATRRRWFRYSLRTFLILVTAVAIGLGLYVKRQRDRHVAIENIKAWGGTVEFVARQLSTNPGDRFARTGARAHAYRNGLPRPEFEEELPQGSAWLRGMLGKYGKYHGSRVVKITFGTTIFTPEDAVMDIGVLAPLDEVKTLSLADLLTDDDLARLPKLPQLEHLHLATLEGFSDRGLVCLDGLPNLRRLQISHGSFTAEGLAHIRSNPKLTGVMLSACELSDDSLAHLAALPWLSELWLMGSTVSDEAIVHLAQLRGLKRLDLDDTNFTIKGVRQLREALPNCQIEATFNNRGGSRARIQKVRQEVSNLKKAATEPPPSDGAR
jgi:hypothetical protein